MKPYVRFYRDDTNSADQAAISTNVADEAAFMPHVIAALAQCLGKEVAQAGDNAQARELALGHVLAMYTPQIVDLCCKFRGYKAPLVDEQRVLTAGRMLPSDRLLIASTMDEKPALAIAGD